MELTRAQIREAATEYQREEPLFVVEQEGIETLGDAFASAEFGRRDAIWVVRWYHRRRLGGVPNRIRREREERFERNGYEEVKRAITDAASAESVDAAVDSLTGLEGVDVSIASAFLFFIDPDRFVVASDREWTALQRAGYLESPYPDELTTEGFERYLAAAREVADEFECDLWTLYRALWRLSPD